MAQKAAKQLAARNTATLNRTLYTTLAFHGFFILFRIVIFRHSFTKQSLLLYTLLSAPSLIIQFWFESMSRPKYGTQPGEVLKSGEDLEAKGLTEYMWDILYWTYGTLAFSAVIGDRAWWAFLVVPVYSIYAAYGAFTGVKQGFSGLAGAGVEGNTTATGTSRRQEKLEQRGQRVKYR